jgi:putative ABC transport system permease protein
VLTSAGSRLTSRTGLPRSLVAAQVSFSVAILFVAGLLLLSFGRLSSVDLGFSKDGVLLVTIDQSDLQDPNAGRAAAGALLDRVRAVPGVLDASLSAWPLFSQGGWISRVRVAGHESDPTSPAHLPVSPGFFKTMGMRFVAGRDFTRADGEPPEPRAVIVNEAFVRRYFDHGPALGRVYDRVGQPPAVPQEVVGVVGDVRGPDLRSPATPTVYVPLSGLGRLEVRAADDPRALVAAVDRAVRSAHPALRIAGISLQSALVANSLLRERLLALLSGFFAGVGVLLAAVGLYGVLSYSVVRRTREIGIRIALGARAGALIVTVVRDAALMTGIGIVVGVSVGLYLSRFVKFLLHDVQPTGALSILLPVGCLLVTALVAAIPPATRASQLNPVDALRAE